jgi:ribonuclease HI
MAKKRFYVVWNGLIPGIYKSWDECQEQIKGVKQALYKSFDTLEEAERAYSSSPHDYIGQGNKEKAKITPGSYPAEIIRNALAVDAACSGNPGMMEYRGVYTATKQELFRIGPYEQGTNNIGEFLAMVHGLAFLKQEKSSLPIYSDSRNAIMWVQKKKCKTLLEREP